MTDTPSPPSPPKRTVVFVNEIAGTTEEKDAATVPPKIAWVDGIPVAKVVMRARGDEREVLSYSADGTLLSSSIVKPK
jgi:hypothetical protein